MIDTGFQFLLFISKKYLQDLEKTVLKKIKTVKLYWRLDFMIFWK